MKAKSSSIVLMFLPACFLVACAYYNSGTHIEAQSWKHSGEASVGDFIEFDDALYSLKLRTIHKRNTPVATILFCFESYLLVYVKEDNGLGYGDSGVGFYVGKGRRSRPG